MTGTSFETGWISTSSIQALPFTAQQQAEKNGLSRLGNIKDYLVFFPVSGPLDDSVRHVVKSHLCPIRCVQPHPECCTRIGLLGPYICRESHPFFAEPVGIYCLKECTELIRSGSLRFDIRACLCRNRLLLGQLRSRSRRGLLWAAVQPFGNLVVAQQNCTTAIRSIAVACDKDKCCVSPIHQYPLLNGHFSPRNGIAAAYLKSPRLSGTLFPRNYSAIAGIPVVSYGKTDLQMISIHDSA